MPAPIRYVQDSANFPDSADVVVIGAGIAGAAATWELAKQGLKVVLIEKGLVGAEQSSRNWG
ncbi:FAD-binding oxidoreductase, partial [Pantoea allii]